MAARGVEAMLHARGLQLSMRSSYPNDSFKFNPFGAATPTRSCASG